MGTDIDSLLACYFAGEATQNQLNQLEDWIAASEENQAYFDDLTLLYEHSVSLPEPAAQPNVFKALAAFDSHMQESSQPIAEEKQPKRKSFSSSYLYWGVAAACMGLLIALSISRYTHRAAMPIELIATTQVADFFLPDSTKVILSEDSQLAYKPDYGKDRRAVELTGEAVFSVSNSSDKQLVVFAGDAIIEDIGTVFKVSAYPDSMKVVVSVMEGKVRMYTKLNEEVLIEANEEATYDCTLKTLVKHKPVGGLYFEFSSTPMDEVAYILSKAYNIQLIFGSKADEHRKITVTFKDDDIDLVVSVIAETLGRSIKKEGLKYVLF